MSDFQERLRSALERAIISSNARTDEEIKAVLLAFRAVACRRIESMRNKDSRLAERAIGIVDEVVAEYDMDANTEGTPSLEEDASVDNNVMDSDHYHSDGETQSQHRSIIRPFLAGAVTALCVGALALLLANRAGYLSSFAVFQEEDEAAFTIPSEDVVFAKSVTPAVLEAADKARQMLAANSDSMSVADGKRFRPFREVFPDLWKSVPVTARQSVNMTIRKDGNAYKLLFASNLCPLIVAGSDMQKDPRRERNASVTTLCTYFSVWNEGGEDF